MTITNNISYSVNLISDWTTLVTPTNVLVGYMGDSINMNPIHVFEFFISYKN